MHQTYAEIDPYPTADVTFYGRSVWPLGEEGEWGLLVEGHGRRALAAVNTHQRDVNGRDWRRDELFRDRWRPGRRPALAVTKMWVTIQESCGCTADQHADHLAAEVEECPCEHIGLPPCTHEYEAFAWTYRQVLADTPGALPVLEVRW
jgi:hypothetical protein